MDPYKPAGPDKLEPFYLKLAADFIAEPLTYLFNLSISHCEIPKIWKSAFVSSLFKGGDPLQLNNYRPISKLCVLSKLLEKLLNEQLKTFLEINNILSPFQSGFRKQHSTVTAVMKVFSDIIDAVDCKKKNCSVLFLDLSKAFDTVDHGILLNRLAVVGLSENAIK